jgi:hypothetical protein
MVHSYMLRLGSLWGQLLQAASKNTLAYCGSLQVMEKKRFFNRNLRTAGLKVLKDSAPTYFTT